MRTQHLLRTEPRGHIKRIKCRSGWVGGLWLSSLTRRMPQPSQWFLERRSWCWQQCHLIWPDFIVLIRTTKAQQNLILFYIYQSDSTSPWIESSRWRIRAACVRSFRFASSSVGQHRAGTSVCYIHISCDARTLVYQDGDKDGGMGGSVWITAGHVGTVYLVDTAIRVSSASK